MVKVENSQEIYKIIFNNDHFIVVDKSVNVLSVPSRLGEKEIRPILGLILERDLGITLFPVHRLDFEVQGLIMFAKTPEAQRAGNMWFEQKLIQKTYHALSQAMPNSMDQFRVGEHFEWRARLLRGKKRAYESPHGKESITEAFLESIDHLGNYHWELRPITGRAHQLRYELFRHQHPIVGDVLYGSTLKFNEAGIALRAFKIDLSKIKNRHEFLLPEIILVKKIH